MYKSKLQELCQGRRWSVPEYLMSREGLDHAPRFKACIVVNGVQFESSDLCRTAKQAQNEVSKLAYEHFMRPLGPPSPSSTASSSSSSSSQGSSSPNVAMRDANEKQAELPKNPETSESPANLVKESVVKDLMEHGGQKMLTQDPSLYKNLLQDLVHKEGFPLPTYVTARSGLPHIPTFICTVEIEGNGFQGIAAKTKKQAEINAAKVAYHSLLERRASRKSVFLDQSSHAKGTNACLSSGSASIPIVIVDFEKGLELTKTLNPTSSLESFKHTESNEVADQEMHSAASASSSLQSNVEDLEMNSAETSMASAWSSSQSNEKLETSSKSTSGKSSDEVYAYLRDPFPSVGASLEEGGSTASTDSECSEDVVTKLNDLNTNLPAETNSLLCVNKVQVFPRRVGMQLPDGTTVLPISDDKWVAVSFDCPSHQIKE
ncbi:hypothetical protein Scep_003559 [Stephania cephalantha]|uniref:DRBM domain-containing protein n=1 Tax=Stephania cephalantha TaxID=152367 RepID=A0AAP0PVW0_9MAGN